MSGWTLLDTHLTRGRVFQRSLGVYELGFLWDSLFNGTADNLHHIELRLKSGIRDAHLFSEDNIARAWLSTKRRYPLAGAIMRSTGDIPLQVVAGSGDDNTIGFASEPCFVIREHDLAVLRPGEIVFGSVGCAENAQRRVATILDGPRPLSEELLVQLYAFRDEGRSDILHLMLLMAHSVMDGHASRTFLRCLLDTLARGGSPGTEPEQISLEDRLAMAIPSMDLEPRHLQSPNLAIRRWRRAAGIVIFQSRVARRQGGHTLPCHMTRSTPLTTPRSGVVSTSLTHAETAVVIANCRLHNMKFGSAYLALAQVAMTRVLYRRYLRGEIPHEEWEYRKRQPHITGGPLNLRPYLDKSWFEKGGGGEFMLSIGFYFYQLPFMTLGTTAGRFQHHYSDGAPPFPELLTFGRFLHRAELAKKQATTFFGHPLFHEIVHAAGLAWMERTRIGTLQWMKRGKTNNRDAHESNDEVLAVTDMAGVWAHGGSSVGSMDLMSPSEYPLPPTHPLSPTSYVRHPLKAGYDTSLSRSISASEDDAMPKIVVENSMAHLHVRPAELYLGAVSSSGLLRMYVFYDRNVFMEGVVKEWLDEVKGAVLWYLGQAHRPGSTNARSC